MRTAAACVAALLLAGCAETGFLAQLGKRVSGSAARAPGEGSFVVGEPYQQGGMWHAPREDYAYDETGLATVVRGRAGARTANGEAFDPARLTAQHPTLQLPAIVRVTNLENGRSVLVRVNDRGPAEPGRLIGLSEGAGRVLGIAATAPAQVRVQVLGAESREVAAEARARTPVPESERIVVAAAPRAPVEAEALPPPPGARAAVSQRQAAPLPAPPPAPPPAQVAALRTEHLPQTLTQGAATPGTLWVQAGAFGSARAAETMRARLASVGPARTSPVTANGRTLYRVRLGPARTVAEADRLLAATLRAGAGDARIVVD
jgi:rare lipoprotein A